MHAKNTLIKLNTDLCVVGGGIAGICTAVTAARCGIKVVLVQDRNVLGGNASSEIRMWIRGAGTHLPLWREGGLIEELALDNIHYNPAMNYSLWDAVLYNKVVSEKNITLMLGSTCTGGKRKGKRLESIEVWQMNTYKRYRIHADYFADCSGDSILAECSGADFTCGRESQNEYGESQAPLHGDRKTMGNSCLMQLRKCARPAPYIPFPFEKQVPDEVLARRAGTDFRGENFWWLELGGNSDTLKNADSINRELLGTAFYTWGRLSSMSRQQDWQLDWVGFLAGKRESRRYLGDYVLTQKDVEEATQFEDEVAYGGWPMDNHNPDGLYGVSANTFGPLSAPYPIPYRCLYSRNVENLFFAGRNISATHLALSSTRVMATCGMIGQAVGCAAAIAKKYAVTPRGVLNHIKEVQRALLDLDCHLLHTPRVLSSALQTCEHNFGERMEKLLHTPERVVEGYDPAIRLDCGERICFRFAPTDCKAVRIVFDSDFARTKEEAYYVRQFPMRCYAEDDGYRARMPDTLVKDYSLEIYYDGAWHETNYQENFSRLVLVPVSCKIEGIALTPNSTYGSEHARIFSIDAIL